MVFLTKTRSNNERKSNIFKNNSLPCKHLGTLQPAKDEITYKIRLFRHIYNDEQKHDKTIHTPDCTLYDRPAVETLATMDKWCGHFQNFT